MPPIAGIAHVELSVRDLDSNVVWYVKLPGVRRAGRVGTAHDPDGIGPAWDVRAGRPCPSLDGTPIR